MTENKIKQLFAECTTPYGWYKDTSIAVRQANGLRRRFKSNELSIGRMIEVLIECGYKITIEKP